MSLTPTEQWNQGELDYAGDPSGHYGFQHMTPASRTDMARIREHWQNLQRLHQRSQAWYDSSGPSFPHGRTRHPRRRNPVGDQIVQDVADYVGLGGIVAGMGQARDALQGIGLFSPGVALPATSRRYSLPSTVTQARFRQRTMGNQRPLRSPGSSLYRGGRAQTNYTHRTSSYVRAGKRPSWLTRRSSYASARSQNRLGVLKRGKRFRRENHKVGDRLKFVKGRRYKRYSLFVPKRKRRYLWRYYRR